MTIPRLYLLLLFMVFITYGQRIDDYRPDLPPRYSSRTPLHYESDDAPHRNDYDYAEEDFGRRPAGYRDSDDGFSVPAGRGFEPYGSETPHVEQDKRQNDNRRRQVTGRFHPHEDGYFERQEHPIFPNFNRYDKRKSSNEDIIYPSDFNDYYQPEYRNQEPYESEIYGSNRHETRPRQQHEEEYHPRGYRQPPHKLPNRRKFYPWARQESQEHRPFRGNERYEEAEDGEQEQYAPTQQHGRRPSLSNRKTSDKKADTLGGSQHSEEPSQADVHDDPTENGYDNGQQRYQSDLRRRDDEATKKTTSEDSRSPTTTGIVNSYSDNSQSVGDGRGAGQEIKSKTEKENKSTATTEKTTLIDEKSTEKEQKTVLPTTEPVKTNSTDSAYNKAKAL